RGREAVTRRVYRAYSLLLAAAFALALPYYLWRDRARGRYRRTFWQRMGRLPQDLPPAGRPSVWVHAVSVGEALTARPLLRALKERFPDRPLYLSTTTVTGAAVAQGDRAGADGLLFAPFDWARPVRRVLARLQPSLLVLVETEIWPNLIHEARRRGTRVAVVNGRLSPRSFGRYRRVRRWLARVLGEVDVFLMQGEAHAQRILALGAPRDRVRVSGNLKYDAVPEPRPPAELAALVPAGTAEAPLWVAGSTVAGEEELVLEALARVRQAHPRLRLLLAPRHPERFAAAAALAEEKGFRTARRSALRGPWAEGDVLVLDTLGELARLYAQATVVFVGGSLVPAGGHNVLEAAVAGKPVVVGPHMENFQEIADELAGEGALVRVASPAELAAEVQALLRDPARAAEVGARARAVVERNRGALARTVDVLAGLVA
ncbi:MAG TPA: 3-deoxy-D-manno-octulosonic acid transferase, partial [Vicinamibacteria bacterium]|nr:3-deoxy-D-manno-octulosonic acid transferase [Vicinamibacteria bacterium]